MTEEEIVQLAEAILARVDLPTRVEILSAIMRAVLEGMPPAGAIRAAIVEGIRPAGQR